MCKQAAQPTRLIVVDLITHVYVIRGSIYIWKQRKAVNIHLIKSNSAGNRLIDVRNSVVYPVAGQALEL